MENQTNPMIAAIEARKKRIVARGEHSNHSHVMFGDIAFLEKCMQVNSSPDYEKALARKAKVEADVKALKMAHFPAGPNYEAQVLAFDVLPQAEKNAIIDTLKPLAEELFSQYNKDIEAMDVATIRHIMESQFVATGESTWTREHTHLPLSQGVQYKYVAQVEWHPYLDEIRRVAD